MKTLEDYLTAAAKSGAPRSGIILGVRMALLGLKQLGLEEPRRIHDDLIVVVETDRCLPDAMEVVTGCRLGNRRLKLADMGKMAATLFDRQTKRAVRIAAREEANRQALEIHPRLEREEALCHAYRELADQDLFTTQFVRVEFSPQELPGYRGQRVLCAGCGEGIAFGKQVLEKDRVLCRACAGQAYYEPL